MSPDSQPVHDRVRLSRTELHVIAEIERHESEKQIALAADGSTSTRRRGLRTTVQLLASIAFWLTTLGIPLLVVPAPVIVHGVGAAMVATGVLTASAWAISHGRVRHPRRPQS